MPIIEMDEGSKAAAAADEAAAAAAALEALRAKKEAGDALSAEEAAQLAAAKPAPTAEEQVAADAADAAAALAAIKDKKEAGEALSAEEEAQLAAAPAPGTEEGSITIGDEPPVDDKTAPAPQWVRDLRERQRVLEKENKELRRQVGDGKPAEQPLGPKPTLEGCKYDDAKYEAELTAWFERKRAADDAVAAKTAEEEAAKKEWQNKLDAYETHKAALKVVDFGDVETAVNASLDVTQRGIIVHAAANPALLVYALGKYPAKLAELAAIKDPVKFAFAISKLEDKVKIASKRSPAPAPEKHVSGSGGAAPSGTVDSQLEALRNEAERTGDYSKLHAHKQKLREAQQQK